jgi:spore maturation protein CgeB
MSSRPELSVVRKANEAFKNGDYSQAIQLYREAGEILGSNIFKANIVLCQSRFHSIQGSLASNKSFQTEYADPERRYKYTDKFRVALIADEFTTNSFRDEFTAVSITPQNWRDKFEEKSPELFFCESAWSGEDSKARPWKGKIYASKKFANENRAVLLEILTYCRKKGIPTVFWNKEDPIHFADRIHDFVKTATEFDFVFTTAAECVDRYKSEYRVQRIFSLPFATNPRLFNPVETGVRSSRIVFAGSWYSNHVQRSKDMEQILESILAVGYELEIYDRYHGDTDPLHQWPERYRRYLSPSQPHSRMPDIYKSSRFGLNFNTVTQSPTMFARRVFELMSSNTLVLSNYARGVDAMFGDAVVNVDKEPDRLRALNEKDIDELRDRALHKVLSEHTYRHRWLQILHNIGVPHAAREFTVTATCVIAKQTDATEAIAWFQQYCERQPGARLLLVASERLPDLEVADVYRQFNRFGVTVTSASYARRYAHLDVYQPIETTHFLAFDIRNPPTADWLGRAVLHLQYASDYPLTPANEAVKRYRIGMANAGAPLLDSQARFGLWLHKSNEQRQAYFV